MTFRLGRSPEAEFNFVLRFPRGRITEGMGSPEVNVNNFLLTGMSRIFHWGHACNFHHREFSSALPGSRLALSRQNTPDYHTGGHQNFPRYRLSPISLMISNWFGLLIGFTAITSFYHYFSALPFHVTIWSMPLLMTRLLYAPVSPIFEYCRSSPLFTLPLTPTLGFITIRWLFGFDFTDAVLFSSSFQYYWARFTDG